jgi:hypothetical protein
LDTVVLFKGLSYLDHWMATTLKNAQAGSTPKPDTYIIYYLYLRSFFPSSTLHDTLRKPYSYYYGFAKNKWNQYNKRLQAMIALSCFRNGDVQTAKNIVASLLQNALFSNEIGMYWKEYNTAGYSWDESPVESHTLLMHAIKEITNNDTLQDKMKKWLLQQKQTQHWSTTAATAEACYALLQDPGVLSEDSSAPLVRMGSMTLRPTPQEAGTGFSRTTIPGEKVTPSMGEIEIRFEKKREPAAQSAWGAIHWQYMDEMDKMTATSGPLTIQKSLFIERSTDSGTTLEPVADGAVIHRGEKVVVRLIVQSERNLEFVHLKDLRAATFEPAMVLSGHQWKKGLHYYQSNKDAGMHFFFDRLPRGTHIFSYPMFVQHSGTFRNGIATVQCLYAPAYNAHTASLNFHVE